MIDLQTFREYHIIRDHVYSNFNMYMHGSRANAVGLANTLFNAHFPLRVETVAALNFLISCVRKQVKTEMMPKSFETNMAKLHKFRQPLLQGDLVQGITLQAFGMEHFNVSRVVIDNYTAANGIIMERPSYEIRNDTEWVLEDGQIFWIATRLIWIRDNRAYEMYA